MAATTAAPPMNDDDVQHSKYEIQTLPPDNINNNNDKSLVLVQQQETDVVTIAHPPAAPFTPSLSGKRKRLKPAKYQLPKIKKEKKKILTPKHMVKRDVSSSLSLGNKKNGTKDILDPVQISPTMVRAGKIQASLGNEYPSFIKMMVRSHVTSCFWMGLPLPFCKSFLPQQETPIVVEDENGEEHILKYIAYRFGLSAGWRTFAVGHNLHEGDVLIFQLVGPCKFKIYIVRANTPKVVDPAIRLLKDTEHKEHITPETGKTESKLKLRKCTTNSNSKGGSKSKESKCKTDTKSKGRKPSSSLRLTIVQKKQKQSESPIQVSSQPMEHSVLTSEVQEGPHKPNLLIELKTFKDFRIMVNKCCIDSELSEEIRQGYYNLCIAKNEILHDGVMDGVYYKLVVGMIGETVSIANVIKNCKPTTRKEEFDVWDSSLKSFEIMGMKVGFLRNRIRALATLAFESEEVKRCVEATEEKNRNANEIKVLEAKLAELYENNRKIDVLLGGLKKKAEEYEIEFKKKVDAPW